MSSTVRIEGVELTAAYANAIASAVFTAGVVAPIVAAVFGLTGPAGGLTPSTSMVGVAMFLGVSLGLHSTVRRIPKDLEP